MGIEILRPSRTVKKTKFEPRKRRDVIEERRQRRKGRV